MIDCVVMLILLLVVSLKKPMFTLLLLKPGSHVTQGNVTNLCFFSGLDEGCVK